jgi:hypothetical protein
LWKKDHEGTACLGTASEAFGSTSRQFMVIRDCSETCKNKKGPTPIGIGPL